MKNTFEHIIQTPSIKYKHAKGMRDIFGKEFHQFHEIFLFISGNAFFTTEQKTIKLKPYTLIVIPENTFHSFHVNGDEADYERYVFNFYNTKEFDQLISKNMKNISVIESLTNGIISDFTSLDDYKYSDFDKKLLIMPKLISVLVELGHLIPSTENISTEFRKITAKCLDYINQNLCSPLTVADLSKNLNYSRSSIMHAFKSDLDLPLYKYIIEKKLIYAHKDIISGMSPTQVSQKYGFSDYSCFYRHYKKHFGGPPSVKSSKW
ncbi:MAG: AraC family transcriptional regulator [Ruminococcaceae bacterium]|nr:AraC family transcriptional regulator [Oscillospiraceae bacterium]